MARMVNCVKLGREAEGMDFPPLPGALGQRVFADVSKEAWQGWLRYQTMLINENRLSLADARARQYLAAQLEAYFYGQGADQVAGFTPQP
ncbi:oxidative damage protection protein [Vogesella sp. DC21W]|uniref:Probable Fe(2+)-trafficking protein n=1 Tax=Vogesella aquatica TaxID=2984206 RepID=A0ABT5J1Z5_9NEIS|nr:MULTISPECIES: oxidative damage protection protein [Vogesella]MDC7718875.1 oxidative damage protection protein [Vogesella aquatica]